ncbi:MAG: hypothetical protein ABEH47_07980, partial [Haloferacaceae archaeon]
TLFLPLAPNPVMGGYVLHVEADRVVDVDLTVEEGVQSIVTSGVATGRGTRDDLPEDVLDRFERRLDAADVVAGIEELERYASDASARLEERARETIAPPRPPAEDRDGDDRRGGASVAGGDDRREDEGRDDGRGTGDDRGNRDGDDPPRDGASD